MWRLTQKAVASVCGIASAITLRASQDKTVCHLAAGGHARGNAQPLRIHDPRPDREALLPRELQGAPREFRRTVTFLRRFENRFIVVPSGI